MRERPFQKNNCQVQSPSLFHKNQIASLTLIEEQPFDKFPRHWATKGPYNFSGCLAYRFGITANFSRGDPGDKRQRTFFCESNLFLLFLFSLTPCLYLFLRSSPSPSSSSLSFSFSPSPITHLTFD